MGGGNTLGRRQAKLSGGGTVLNWGDKMGYPKLSHPGEYRLACTVPEDNMD